MQASTRGAGTRAAGPISVGTRSSCPAGPERAPPGNPVTAPAPPQASHSDQGPQGTWSVPSPLLLVPALLPTSPELCLSLPQFPEPPWLALQPQVFSLCPRVPFKPVNPSTHPPPHGPCHTPLKCQLLQKGAQRPWKRPWSGKGQLDGLGQGCILQTGHLRFWGAVGSPSLTPGFFCLALLISHWSRDLWPSSPPAELSVLGPHSLQLTESMLSPPVHLTAEWALATPSIFASVFLVLLLVRGLPQWEGLGSSQNKVIICLPAWGVLQNLPQGLSDASCQCRLEEGHLLSGPGLGRGRKMPVFQAEWGTP